MVGWGGKLGLLLRSISVCSFSLSQAELLLDSHLVNFDGGSCCSSSSCEDLRVEFDNILT